MTISSEASLDVCRPNFIKVQIVNPKLKKWLVKTINKKEKNNNLSDFSDMYAAVAAFEPFNSRFLDES